MNDDIKRDIELSLKTFKPIIRQYWWIKFSNYKGNILIFIGSILSGQVVTKYFKDEDLAVDYVNWILHQDPSTHGIDIESLPQKHSK